MEIEERKSEGESLRAEILEDGDRKTESESDLADEQRGRKQAAEAGRRKRET